MRLYLDTNFFIEAVEGDGTASENCWQFLKAGEERPGLLVTSLLTLSEVLVGPLQARDDPHPKELTTNAPLSQSSRTWLRAGTIAAEYADILTDAPRLAVCAIDRNIAIAAAHIRMQWRTGKLPDAIHLATAQIEQCTHVISADRKLCSAAKDQFSLQPVAPSGMAPLLSELDVAQ